MVQAIRWLENDSVEESEQPKGNLVAHADFNVVIHHITVRQVLDLLELLAFPTDFKDENRQKPCQPVGQRSLATPASLRQSFELRIFIYYFLQRFNNSIY